ncbi:HAD family hydrolase [Proteinivorax hydrogeniformans]|uniref:HAD family hydrolase n=1 Tax=Proteinivorax hydrogeniformans TaxID=1826727 RepID=A0AAU8HUT3_9FIRM
MYKIIAIDIDGTLIDKCGNIQEKTAKAIKTASAQGMIVTLSTGRSYHSALCFAKKLNIKAPLITANGSMIRDPQNGELKKCHRFSKNTVNKMLEILKNEKEVFIQGYHLDGIVSFGRNNLIELAKMLNGTNKFSFKNTIRMLKDYKESKVSIKKSLTIEDGYDIHKFFVVGDKKSCKNIEGKLANLSCRIESHFVGNYGYLEIIPEQASKGEGLIWLAEYYNVPLDKTIAIGDSANDISMFKKAGMAIAMANGTNEAKQNANHITFSNNDNGVATAIKEFALTKKKDFDIIKRTV